MTSTKIDPASEFSGAKIVILYRGRLLSLLRDEFHGLPFPGRWDLPGGGREGNEDPLTCALRETREETGIQIETGSILWRRNYDDRWFFVAIAQNIDGLRLGDEGQALRWFAPRVYVDLPKGIAQLQNRLMDYLDEVADAG